MRLAELVRWRSDGVPAYVCQAIRRDPSILDDWPAGRPAYTRKGRRTRIAPWLARALTRRGYYVTPHTSELDLRPKR